LSVRSRTRAPNSRGLRQTPLANPAAAGIDRHMQPANPRRTSDSLRPGDRHFQLGQFDCGGRAGWKIDGQRRILAGWLRSLAPNYLRLPLLSAVPHHGSGASTSALRFLFLGLRAPIQVLDSPGMMPCFRYSHQSRAGKNDPQTPRLLVCFALKHRTGAGTAQCGLFHRGEHHIPLRLQPQLYCLRIKISLRRLAIFLNGSLSVFALRRTAKVVRFRALAMVSTLFALRTSARSSLSPFGRPRPSWRPCHFPFAFSPRWTSWRMASGRSSFTS
jgi:hypothetical protein